MIIKPSKNLVSVALTVLLITLVTTPVRQLQAQNPSQSQTYKIYKSDASEEYIAYVTSYEYDKDLETTSPWTDYYWSTDGRNFDLIERFAWDYDLKREILDFRVLATGKTGQWTLTESTDTILYEDKLFRRVKLDPKQIHLMHTARSPENQVSRRTLRTANADTYVVVTGAENTKDLSRIHLFVGPPSNLRELPITKCSVRYGAYDVYSGIDYLRYRAKSTQETSTWNGTKLIEVNSSDFQIKRDQKTWSLTIRPIRLDRAPL